ncbi:uroporphyrinogen decarboxylase family protein [uncultured Paludibaculum sp.]|uniref:uroporphyrinogen decarboxylase family protein n=1 Tax=uncultured Paludibaculum sp. TaxID=1765020 RepID=UPI002AABA1F0|nr:uroporphyrinogen decarboxylase family protein [uncultured Paludibaculum sp.]
MRQEQWDAFKKAAKREAVDSVPLALIVDSPWMPGYVGINHLDYFLDPEAWFQANLKVASDFPEVIPFPSWWMEYGMAIEPSSMGARISFVADQPPSQHATLRRLDDLDGMVPIDPWRDGFMSLALHRYKMQKQRIFDAGYIIPVVAARGPLCTAGFVHDVNSLMMNILDDSAGVHRLLSFVTDGIIAWLKAQAEAIGPCVEGIFVLDDVVGFLSRDAYNEFAAPYLKRICDAFPREWVKVYHNDASIKQFLDDLPDTGFDVLNFSHKVDIAEAARRTGGRMTLMGNVSPLDLGVRGTPEAVKAAALDVLRKTEGRNLILSLGGGVSPGMPAENIRALVDAIRTFEANR